MMMVYCECGKRLLGGKINMMYKMSKSIDRIIIVFFGLLSLFIFISKIFEFVYVMPDLKYKTVSILILLFFFLIFFYEYKRISCFGRRMLKLINALTVKKMVIILILLSFGLRTLCMYVFQIDSSGHPDMEMYWSYIQQLSSNGVIREHIKYASRVPYTVIYATMFLPITKLFGSNNILIMNLYLNVLFTVSTVLMFDLINYYSNKNRAFISMMIWTLLPTGMTETLLLVHENGFVFFHSLAIWIFFRLLPICKKNVQKILCVLLTGFTISYAALFNKFGLVSICAFVLIFIIRFLRHPKSLKYFIKIGLSILLIVSCYFVSSSYINSYIKKVVPNQLEYQQEDDVFMGWPLYVGLNYESRGGRIQEDADRWEKNVDNKKEYQLTLLRERINEYMQNPIKILIHLKNKMQVVWGQDFNPIGYGMGGEINNFILTWHGGIIYSLYMRVCMIVGTFLSFILMFSLKINKVTEDSDYIKYIKMFMIGVTTILMFTEVMPKYSSHMLFLFLIVMVNGFSSFVSNMNYLMDTLYQIVGRNFKKKAKDK